MHSIDDSNLINGKPIYYLVNQKDVVVAPPTQAGLIALVNCANMTVGGQTVSNNSQGIVLANTNNSRIIDCNVANNTAGIWMYFSYKNILSSNNATNNGDYGIYLQSSSNNIISGNSISNTQQIGLLLSSSTNNTLYDNTMDDNRLGGFAVWSGSAWAQKLIHYMHFVDDSNFINGKPIYYLVNQTDTVVTPVTHPQAGYIVLVNCTNMTVEGQTIADNFDGVTLAYTSSSTITNCSVTSTREGIALYSSFNNTVFDNAVTSNYIGIYFASSSANTICQNNITKNENMGIALSYCTEDAIFRNSITSTTLSGVWLDSCTNITVWGNDVRNNGLEGIMLGSSAYCNIYRNNITRSYYGVELSYYGGNNKIHHNNFMYNTQQVLSRTYYANSWDDGVEGNYWSDYAGVDINNDGIGDSPYVIDSNNKDTHPLMQPAQAFEAGTWGNKTYFIDVSSNSNITNFTFNPYSNPPILSFDVAGVSGTDGFCRVAIPKDIMWCNNKDEWTITVGGTLTSATNITETNDYTYIYFTYTHSTKTVQIQSTHAVPEFQPTLILPLLVTITLLATVFRKRKRTH